MRGRTIRAFWGGLNPLYGSVGAAQGDIEALRGRTIRAFWGNLNPLYGAIDPLRGRTIRAFEGDMRPFYGSIDAFWEKAGSDWNETDKLWGAAGTDASSYAGVTARLNALVAESDVLWGAAVTRRTGRSFSDAFAKPLFARHGIDPANPAALGRLSASDRAYFFIDWYDGLMTYADVDHVDHWMFTANWSPALTQLQGGGTGVKVGLLDFAITADRDVRSKIEFTKLLYSYDSSKSPAVPNTHGTAVASLMVASHDGKGVMGIAPSARLIHFDPFDYDGSANFQEIQTGLKELGNKGATVINMSLGVANWTLHPEWKRVFASGDMTDYSGKAVFVIAGGNEGITQLRHNHDGIMNPIAGQAIDKGKVKDGTGTIEGLATVDTLKAIKFDKSLVPTLIVVGSVDPMGTISSFSNRPGDACLFAVTGDCKEFGTIAERFIVAPGELMLVADGNGGIVRMSGTSFAAPLVTGAITLLQGRWPWLKNFPKETADIIFRSAKDLGAPGTDPVYGRGLLDVTASQSPLDFNAMTYFQATASGMVQRPMTTLRAAGTDMRASWEANGVSFTAYETIGRTRRDFAIPLSTKLVGKTSTLNGQQHFQSYITSRMVDWTTGFTDASRAASATSRIAAWNVTTTMGVRSVGGSNGGFRQQGTYGIAAGSDAASFRFGTGEGALALSGQSGFALFSDFDPATGGANPLLGFASGGAYASADLAVAPQLRLSAGVTQQQEHRGRSHLVRSLDDMRAYDASAMHVAAQFRASERLTVDASYTTLRERTGLLGIQSLDASDIGRGSASDALTVSTQWQAGSGIALAVSATVARTRDDRRSQNLNVSDGGLMASAFEVAATKTHVFGRFDRARLSIAQPLFIEKGELEYTSVEVVDRSTGALGVVTQRFDASTGGRRFVAEALYSHALLGGTGEVSGFGRSELGGKTRGTTASFTVGSRFRMSF